MGSKEKKRSKKVSQGRKKKGERDSKKRSAKKLPCHEDSYSESDADSRSLVSSSSYCSEEGVWGKRSRSRARKDVKRHKKRVRSSSSGSHNSSDSVRVKKRKSSKRKVSVGRKKKHGKKYKRAASLSSTSSDESGYEKTRGESKKKEIRRRYDKEDKIKGKRKRKKAQSISPSNESIASDNERKRKRYGSPSRSSLSMSSSESERAGKRKRYWSPSGSSLSRGSKSSHQHVQDEIEVQNLPIRKLNSIIVVAATAETDQNAMSKGLETYLDLRDDERSMKSSIVEKGENIEETKSATKAMAPVPDGEDLESILRRKALENLKRFRGPKMSEKSEKMEMSVSRAKQLPNSENAADQENAGGSDMKHSLSSEIEPIQNEWDKDRVVSVNLASSSEKEEVLAGPSVNNKNASFKNNVDTKTASNKSAEYSEDNRRMISKADNLNLSTIADTHSNIGNVSVSIHNLISQSGKFSNVKVESDSLVASQEPLATLSTQECLDTSTTPVPSKCDTNNSNTQVDEVNPKSLGNIIKESNIVNTIVTDNPSSSLPDNMAGEHVSPEHQRNDKEDSQFQEKTMTVMRGGELVQVSYKVYVPKKAPAVNRRRLNR